MSIWTKMSLYLGAIVALVSAFYLYRYLRRKWLDYQANKDRSYNVFDKAELNSAEKTNLKKWNFEVPPGMEEKIKVKILEDERDHEIEVVFNL
jgi:hypothetical protein